MPFMETGKLVRVTPSAGVEKPLLAALNGQAAAKVPVWLMRQAGRYLPEYRAVREKAGGFLNLVYNPALACEVTMQPIRRFGMTGAILFSDILVIPQALGQTLTFTAGEGPALDPVRSITDLSRLTFTHFDETLAPIHETIRRVRASLKAENFDETALIGFAGAPWTIACYMVEGGGSTGGFPHAKRWAAQDPDGFDKLVTLITDATIRYLAQQIDAGVEAVQLFDSWAGSADETTFRRWVIEPAKTIAHTLRARYPHIPLIGFPRGAGSRYKTYAQETGVSALGLDYDVSLPDAAMLQSICPVQGNLNPEILLAGGGALTRAATEILETLGGKPFIFNLGHGVIKETPPEHVAHLINLVQSWRA